MDTLPMTHALTRSACALAIFSVVLGSTAPSPLYPLYVDELSLSQGMVTGIFAIYALGTLVALFLTPHLSRHVRNERSLLIAGLVMTASGSLIFAFESSVWMLLAGRFLGGAGTGFVTGTASAIMFAVAPPDRRAAAARYATLAFTGGAAGGPLLTSAMIGLDLAPTVMPFVIISGVVVLACIGLLMSRWPAAGALPSAIMTPEPAPGRLTVAVRPSNAFFRLACMTVGVAWMIGSVLMASGTTIGRDLFGLQSAAVAGLMPALFQLLAGVGQIAFSRLDSLRAIRLGLLGIALSQGVVMAALITGMPGAALMIAMPFFGFFYGAAFVGALALANASADPGRRVASSTRFFTVGYLSNAIPTLAFGFLSDASGLHTAYLVFSVSLILLAALTFGFARVLAR